MSVERILAAIAVVASLLLGGCVSGGERIGVSAAQSKGVTQTSLLPASVPYYFDLCGQDPTSPTPRYELLPPAKLERWGGTPEDVKHYAQPYNISHKSGSPPVVVPRDRDKCLKKVQINNGDPITVRLNRVGLGGMATFDPTTGKCRHGCLRDIAIVLDFNASTSLQQPIVAFYQEGVRPDGALQFANQTVFHQDEWFERFPPSIRVRLYDVRENKDAKLRAYLDTVRQGSSVIQQFIAGAAIAGPIVDTAIRAADQVIDGHRNRLIMDMSFQLFPQVQKEQKEPKEPEGQKGQAAAEKARIAAEKLPDGELGAKELKQLQEKLGVTPAPNFGPKTKAAMKNKTALAFGDTGYFRKARQIIAGGPSDSGSGAGGGGPNDATFGSPIYASQLIVFTENATTYLPSFEDKAHFCPSTPAVPDEQKRDPRRLIGDYLPTFYYVPDGINYSGAKVYAKFGANPNGLPVIDPRQPNYCLVDTPFVVFSITRGREAVAADVAARMSELQKKFSADASITESTVASLSSAFVDAQLALAIDRLENRRRGIDLIALVDRLAGQIANARPTTSADGKKSDLGSRSMPSAIYRDRTFRLISDYTNCLIADDDNSVTNLNKLKKGLEDSPAVHDFRVTTESVPYMESIKASFGKCPSVTGPAKATDPTIADPKPDPDAKTGNTTEPATTATP